MSSATSRTTDELRSQWRVVRRERDKNRGPLEQDCMQVQRQSHWSGGAMQREGGGEVGGERQGRELRGGGRG